MTLPDAVRDGVERALTEHGLGRRIDRFRAATGGCINNGGCVTTDSGASGFVKWNTSAPLGMFEAEADGLRALAAAGPIRVPTPYAWGTDASASWLLMEYVSPGTGAAASLVALGAGLAELHSEPAGHTFGWHRDNWIGSLDQANPPGPNWADFWRDHRIRPQLDLARDRGRAKDVVFDRLLQAIPAALADIGVPELVHGDLWGGNWFPDDAGAPVIIDPAVYRGHGEVDLAMSELFGGFGPDFYSAYGDMRGITREYEAFRRDLYQLYYLLVHVNLFGGAYEAGARRSAEKVVTELR